MKKIKIITIFVLLFSFQQSLLSCRNKKNSNSIEIGYHERLLNDTKESSRLLAKAINEGDLDSYNKISNAYLLAERTDDLYYYALLMANKHKCAEAYYHLFLIMNEEISINGVELHSKDERTKNMSLYYLLKSKELGYEGAQNAINEVFGNDTAELSSFFYFKKIEPGACDSK